MVKYDIFKHAQKLHDEGKVFLEYATDKVVVFIVKDQYVRFTQDKSGTKFTCSCKHHSLYPDCLCKRVIAAILYLQQNHGKIKRTK